MQKSTLYAALAIVFVLCNGFLLFRLKEADRNKDNVSAALYSKLNNCSNTQAISNRYLLVQYEDLYKTLPQFKLYNSSDNSVSVKEVLNGKETLVFRYTELNCDVCVHEELKNLNEAGIKAIILTSYSRDKDLILFKKINKIKFPVYNLKNIKLPLEMEKLNVPYYFTLTTDLKVGYPFLPIKEISGKSDYYLSLINNKLNQINNN